MPSSAHPTRRRLLTGAAAAGGVALATSLVAPRAGAEAEPSMPSLLRRALELEGLAEFALGHVAEGFPLSGSARHTLATLQAHERAHAARVAAELGPAAPAGATAPPDGPASADALLKATRVGGSLAKLPDAKHALELLLRIEYSLEGVYLRIVQHALRPELAVLAAEILAVEAQHVALLRIVHQPDYLPGAVPDAFVVGPQ